MLTQINEHKINVLNRFFQQITDDDTNNRMVLEQLHQRYPSSLHVDSRHWGEIMLTQANITLMPALNKLWEVDDVLINHLKMTKRLITLKQSGTFNHLIALLDNNSTASYHMAIFEAYWQLNNNGVLTKENYQCINKILSPIGDIRHIQTAAENFLNLERHNRLTDRIKLHIELVPPERARYILVIASEEQYFTLERMITEINSTLFQPQVSLTDSFMILKQAFLLTEENKCTIQRATKIWEWDDSSTDNISVEQRRSNRDITARLWNNISICIASFIVCLNKINKLTPEIIETYISELEQKKHKATIIHCTFLLKAFDKEGLLIQNGDHILHCAKFFDSKTITIFKTIPNDLLQSLFTSKAWREIKNIIEKNIDKDMVADAIGMYLETLLDNARCKQYVHAHLLEFSYREPTLRDGNEAFNSIALFIRTIVLHHASNAIATNIVIPLLPILKESLHCVTTFEDIHHLLKQQSAPETQMFLSPILRLIAINEMRHPKNKLKEHLFPLILAIIRYHIHGGRLYNINQSDIDRFLAHDFIKHVIEELGTEYHIQKEYTRLSFLRDKQYYKINEWWHNKGFAQYCEQMAKPATNIYDIAHWGRESELNLLGKLFDFKIALNKNGEKERILGNKDSSLTCTLLLNNRFWSYITNAPQIKTQAQKNISFNLSTDSSLITNSLFSPSTTTNDITNQKKLEIEDRQNKDVKSANSVVFCSTHVK